MPIVIPLLGSLGRRRLVFSRVMPPSGGFSSNSRTGASNFRGCRRVFFNYSPRFSPFASIIQWPQSTATSIRNAVAYGGEPKKHQKIAFTRKPDILIGCPGRIIDFFENDRAFHLSNVGICVLDEADRMLDMGFEVICNFYYRWQY